MSRKITINQTKTIWENIFYPVLCWLNQQSIGWCLAAGGERHVCNVRAELSNLGANTPDTCGQMQLSFGRTKIQMFIANLRRGTQILRIGVNV